MASNEEMITLISPDNEDDLKLQSNPADHCLVTIEQTDPLYTVESQRISDLELADKVPPLPVGKDKHLFVSHSSENFEEVMEIVNQFEQRFNVSCIISDRDFEPGKDIFANIKGSMKRSLKNVFMLTPEFVQSGFCKFERDMAFMTSVESGISTVIPVLLHECNIPTSLVAVTYIDGTYPGVDIPAKIIQALIQSELTHNNLIVEDHALSRRYENAYCVAIQSQKKVHWFGCKPSEYIFELNEELLTRLRNAKINLPVIVMMEAFNVLNNDRKVQLYDCTRSCWNTCRWNLCIFPVWLCIFFICYILIFKTSLVMHDVQAYTILLIQEVNLQITLWEHIGPSCIQNNVITLVERKRKSVPILYVMRYNIADCKTYLAGLIRSNERGKPEEVTDPEVRADEMIDRAISRLVRHLTRGIEELPDAPYNRHNVRKSKMCLCQLVEAGSPLVN